MPKNVLVIGSNVATRDSLALTLSQTGHELRVAAGLHEAIKIIWAKAPDVIIVDLDIPEIDLKYFTGEALRVNSRVCIVALTVKEKLTEQHRPYINHILEKPYSEMDVLRTMQACLDGHREPDKKNNLA